MGPVWGEVVNGFHFDQETHTYTIDGEVIPSVTEILRRAGLIDSKWYTPESAARGAAVHTAIAREWRDAQTGAGLEPIPEDVAPYLAAWWRFRSDCHFEPIPTLCEAPQYHPIYRYAGTPDLLGVLNGRAVVVDVKTGNAPTVGIQLAAYANLPAMASYLSDRFSLRLFPTGRYALTPHNDPNDWLQFRAALAQYTHSPKDAQ